MTPSQLRAALEATYPPNASCWSQATDEVRDMSRYAREILKLPESEAVNFRDLNTPAAWNSAGIKSIVSFYKRMSAAKKADFLTRMSGFY